MGVEGEDGHVAPRAGFHAVHFRADGLGRVLNDEQVMPFRQRHDRGHVRYVAVEVHDHDGLCFRGDALFDGFGADHVRDGVHVRPDEFSALLGVGIGRGGEGVGGDDHLVARLEVAKLRGEFEGGNAVHDREAVLGPDVFPERLFKALKVFALRQRLGAAHGFHDHRDLLFRVPDRASAEIHFDVHSLSCLIPAGYATRNGVSAPGSMRCAGYVGVGETAEGRGGGSPARAGDHDFRSSSPGHQGAAPGAGRRTDTNPCTDLSAAFAGRAAPQGACARCSCSVR